MLYLVSGASRAGKTLVARRLFKEAGVPYLSLDWLVMGFTNGIPEYGIDDKLMPDEIASRIWSFLESMLKCMIWSETDYVVEGEAIDPDLIAGLINSNQDRVRICFLGYTNIDVDQKIEDVLKYSDGVGDWLVMETRDRIRFHIHNMIDHSRNIEIACAANSMRYFDTSDDFPSAVNRAVRFLLGGAVDGPEREQA